MSHPVQRCCFEEELRSLLGELSRVQRRAKDRLAAEEGGFCQAAPMIPRLLLPAAPALATDRPQVLIPLPGRRGAVAVLPDFGVPPRRDDRLGPTPLNGLVTPPLVIGPVRTHLAKLPRHASQEVRQ